MEQGLAQHRRDAMLESDDMPNPFWTAFYAGLTAPTSLYAPPAPYDIYTVPVGPAEAFAITGIYLSNAVAAADERSTEEEVYEVAQ